jgi:SIR2-like domain
MPLPPPYPFIYSRLIQGQVVPFLGAGVPLYSRDPRAEPWADTRGGQPVMKHLPTAGELARELKREAGLDEEGEELTKMAQYYQAVLGPEPLRDRLHGIFSYAQAPTPLHEFLAGIEKPLLIVTTNYDDLMERALQALGKPFDVVVHLTDKPTVLYWAAGEQEPEEVMAEDLLVELETTPVIYKMHGAIDRRDATNGRYVITEDDYVEFLTRMTRTNVIPHAFAKPFKTRPFLFLGYGLYDWNLRVLLNSIQAYRENPKFRSWAIETLVKPVEQRLWTARGVDVYDGLSLKDFLTELKAQAPAPAAGGVSNT